MNDILVKIINCFGGLEKISDVCFVGQYYTNNMKHIESRSAWMTVMFNDSHVTISDNRNINLYFHSIFSIAPKGCDPEMLLYPSEKEFYLPSLFVKHRGFFGIEKFPTARFVVSRVTRFVHGKATVSGKITIKGKTKELSFDLIKMKLLLMRWWKSTVQNLMSVRLKHFLRQSGQQVS